MKVKMLKTTNGAMYGIQTDIRLFKEGEVYDDTILKEQVGSISPCLVKVFLQSNLAEIVTEEKMMPVADENKMMPVPPENKTETPVTITGKGKGKGRGRKPKT